MKQLSSLLAVGLFGLFVWWALPGDVPPVEPETPDTVASVVEASESAELAEAHTGPAREAVAPESVPEEPESGPVGAVAAEEPVAEADEELLELWFQLLDLRGTPLTNGSVSVEGSAGEHATGSSRPDGYIRVPGVPPGKVEVEARAPGYATVRYETVVPWSPPRTEGLEMEPAARLEGLLVSRDGEPFEGEAFVAYWVDGAEERVLTTSVVGPSFGVDDVARGVVHLVAGMPGVGTGPVSTAVVGEELGDPVAVIVPGEKVSLEGRVLRASDRRGVVATVSLAPPEGVRASAMATVLPATETDGEGRFTLSVGHAERVRVVVRADGYSTRELEATLPERGSTDLGDVLVEPARPLTVRLVSHRPTPFRGVRIYSEDARIPLSAFDENGVFHLADYPLATVNAWINLPDTNKIQILAHVPPERLFEVPLDGLSSAVVDFALDSVKEGPWAVIATHEVEKGYELRRAFYLEDLAPIRIEGIPRTPVSCLLQDLREGAVLGRASGSFVDGEPELHLTIRGGGRRKSFRIVDGEGRPLLGARLCVAPADGEGFRATLTVGEDGTWSSDSLPAEPLVGYVLGDGVRTAIPIEDGPEHQEIEVAATATLVTLVELDGLPLPGASVNLTDPRALRIVAEPRPTDANGQVVWSGLHPGPYLVQIRHPDASKLDEETEIPAGQTIRTYALRRP